jgi:hypothetical protein
MPGQGQMNAFRPPKLEPAVRAMLDFAATKDAVLDIPVSIG